MTFIAATPEAVWAALVERTFTQQYFFGLAIEIEPAAGGSFKLLKPEGSVHVSGTVIEWAPPRRLCVSWSVEGMAGFAELPACLVSYDIETAGACVRLTMTEAHSWSVPEAILAGGRSGWPMILSGLKSLLETGRPLAIAGGGPPAGLVEAVQKVAAEKPWLKPEAE